MRKTVSGIMVTLLLTGMLTFVLNVQPVKASGTIYIRSDGSIDPPTAPISSLDNVTYTLTGNINDSIVVERDNIVVDGNWFLVQGTNASDSNGIKLSRRKNVTIENAEIGAFWSGISIADSSNNNIVRNDLTNNKNGIGLLFSSHNSIIGNNITNNEYGLSVLDSSNHNSIFGNALTNNGRGIWLAAETSSFGSSNNIISGNDITDNNGGILLLKSSTNVISGNNITNNWDGIQLATNSDNNSIVGNNIANNEYGVISFYGPCYNRIYHNNFVNNTIQVDNWMSYYNVWDDGYPSGGNYWDDYSGVDANGDGIGDTLYLIDIDNQDRFPLVHSWGSLPVHNINTGLGYATIQEAINAIETINGHTIFVETGTYYENVVVNKTISLIGESRDNSIIDGNGISPGTVVTVTADNVVLSNFTIQNSGFWPEDAGIRLNHSNSSTIIGNIMRKNVRNIDLMYSFCSFVGDNIVSDALYCGISSRYSDRGKFINNVLVSIGHGFDFWESNGNTLSNNEVHGPGTDCGISFTYSDHNNVTVNLFSGNEIGINLGANSNDNEIIGNIITLSDEYGILAGADRNIIYHNSFISNARHVWTDSINMWDNGYPSGGNYWSNYTGIDIKSGLSQDLLGSDGIGDTSYIIDENNRDRYPLMYPYGAPPPSMYALTITATVGGTTDPSLGTYSYTANSSIQITAIPNVDYAFDHWELDTAPISVYVGISYDPSYTGGLLVMSIVPGGPADKAGLKVDDIIKQVDSLQVNRAEELRVYVERCKNPGDTIDLMINRNNLIIQITVKLERTPIGLPNPYVVLTDNNHTLKAVFTYSPPPLLPWDITGDGYVGIEDIVTAGEHFGESPDRRRWNSNCDLNLDNYIGIDDMVIIASHFGQRG